MKPFALISELLLFTLQIKAAVALLVGRTGIRVTQSKRLVVDILAEVADPVSPCLHIYNTCVEPALEVKIKVSLNVSYAPALVELTVDISQVLSNVTI